MVEPFSSSDVPPQHCPIWGRAYRAKVIRHLLKFYVYSERTGGRYIIESDALNHVSQLTDNAVRARLTTMLVDKRRGEEWPEVTLSDIEEAKRKRPLPVYTRADRLLQCIAEQVPMGDIFTRVSGSPLAWSESVTGRDQEVILDYLVHNNRIVTGQTIDESDPEDLEYTYYKVTLEGHHHLETLSTISDTAQAFIAMWFDPSMDGVYENGIRPAIEATGYTPLRIDQKEHNNKIDDEIIAEIRRSRFVVADFTHGDDGVRGSVYYEAGFAYGLDIPVIYLSREGSDLAFDTRQYAHIMWKDTDELSDQLQNRILAVIGEGPNIVESP